VIIRLRQQGCRVLLISSGAVGVGRVRLGLTERPQTLAAKQAIAAVGQSRLMRVYDDLFANLQQPIAQVLLTRRELMERGSYVNITNTFQELFALGVVPIVNENDTVAVDELKFGDNDTLSARVASLVKADWLFILTDVDRLYSADPRHDPTATPIASVAPHELAQLQVKAGGSHSQWGTGGMATKLAAARIATSAGVKTAIAQGRDPTNIERILQGEAIGTRFEPQPNPEPARKRWIAHGSVAAGALILDRGAVRALCKRGKSLLAAGIVGIEGEFQARETVALHDPECHEIGRGLVNYSSQEITTILGKNSSEISELLGYSAAETVIHRDNLVIFERSDRTER
ncbi:MAG: glutamate 5-kinase, partial [Cyanobacteria bacterium J06641_5]